MEEMLKTIIEDVCEGRIDREEALHRVEVWLATANQTYTLPYLHCPMPPNPTWRYADGTVPFFTVPSDSTEEYHGERLFCTGGNPCDSW